MTIKARHLLYGAAAAALGYALWWEPAMRLRVVRWRLTPDRWRGRDPVRIVVISDLHAGAPHIGRSRLRNIVRRANALRPDVAVLLGDYSAAHPFTWGFTGKDEVVAMLAEFHGRHGIWGVVGNHDWWQDPKAQSSHLGPIEAELLLEEHGIPVLDNRAVRIGGQDGFWLAGIGDQRPFESGPNGEGMDDLDAALACVTDDAPVVLLAHEPDIFAQLSDAGGNIAVQVSGHTHGGQIRLFGGAPLIMLSENETYCWGHYHENGRDMIVSGGIGCSVLPMRVGVPPEITVIDIAAPD